MSNTQSASDTEQSNRGNESRGSSYTKILPNGLGQLGIGNRSWIALMVLYSPVLFGYLFFSVALSGRFGLVPYIGLLVYAAGATVALRAAPSDESIKDYFGSWVAFHTQQQIMLHDTDPDESGVEQPTNDSIWGKIGRLPWVRTLPYIGAGESPRRCQNMIPFEKALDQEYVMVTDGKNGATDDENDSALPERFQPDKRSLVVAIRVLPANMSTAGPDEWERRVDQLSSVLASSIDGKAQWYNPTRAVDYSTRKQAFADADTEMRRLLRRYEHMKERGDDDSSDIVDEDGPMFDVIADIAHERAGVVDRYEESTFVQDHYVLLRLEPDQVVLDELNDGGGIMTVEGIGRLITEWKLALEDDEETEERMEQMVQRATRRAEQVASSLRGIDGIDAHPIPSTEFAQVAADHYRAANMYAYTDFRQLVRQSPSPAVNYGDQGDPGREVSYDHSSEESATESRSIETPDTHPILGELRGDEDVEPAIDGDGEDDDLPDGTGENYNPNEGMVANLASDEEERKGLFKDLLAPWDLNRSNSNYLEIEREQGDGVYSMTLAVSDWPGNPQHGLLEPVLDYAPSGVEVVPVTHMESVDKTRAETILSDLYEATGDKVEMAEDKWWIPTLVGAKFAKAQDMIADVQSGLEKGDGEMFTSNTYIEIRASEKEKLSKVKSGIEARLKDVDTSVKPLTRNHDEGYKTVAPAVNDTARQQVRMLGEGIAALFSWSTRNLHEEGGVSLGLHSERMEPTVWDVWRRGTGYNIGIFGDIGSGKTTTTLRMLMRMKLLSDWEGLLSPQKEEEMMIVAMDPLEEFAGLCQLFGGQRVVVGGDTYINPLHYERPPEEKRGVIGEGTAKQDAKRRAMSFIESYYSLEDIQLGEGERSKKGVWQRAFKIAYDNAGHGEDSPTLTDVFDVMRDMANNPADHVDDELEDNEAALNDRVQNAVNIVNNDIEPFKEDGVFHNLTFSTELDLDDHSFVYYDLQRFEDDDKGGLLMEVLRDRAYEYAKNWDGKTVICMDEAHYQLRNESNMEGLKLATRHSRHHDLSLIFSSQSVSEFFAKSGGNSDEESLTESAEIIFNNMSTRLYHYLTEMNDEWGSELDLSNAEQAFIEDARNGKEEGVADALLQIDNQGCFGIEVDMGNRINPREFAVNEYDPSDHGESLRDYLAQYSDPELGDVCRWSFMNGRLPAVGGNADVSDGGGFGSAEVGDTTDDMRQPVTDGGNGSEESDSSEGEEAETETAHQPRDSNGRFVSTQEGDDE